MINDVVFPNSSYYRDLIFLKTQLLFAIKASQILKIRLVEAIYEYTEFMFLSKQIITNDIEYDLRKMEVKEDINIDDLTNKIIKIIESKSSNKNHVRKNCYGVMGVDIDIENKSVQWHTLPFPLKSYENSIFKITELPKRKYEFNVLNVLMKYIYEKYFNDIEYLYSYSWLFNLDSVKRIFPKSFIKNPQKVRRGYRGLATWGQFLNKSYGLNNELVKNFIYKVDLSTNQDMLFDSFPYPTLLLKSNIKNIFKDLGF